MRKGSFLFILSLALALQAPLLAQRDPKPEEQQTESKKRVKEKKVQEELSDEDSTDPVKEEKKVKATIKAQEYFDAKEYSLAIDVLKKAFSKEKSREKKTEIAFMMGECYRYLLNYKQAASQYKRAVKLGYGAEAQYQKAQMVKSQGEYEDAILEFEALKAMSPGDKRAEQGIETCRLAAEWKSSPSRYIVEPAEELNTRDRDMTPLYSGRPGTYDEILMVSSREGATGNKEDGWTGESFMDIWMSAKERKSGGKRSRRRRGKSSEVDYVKFSTPVPLDPIVNSKDHEGTMAFDSRRKELYITRCRVEKYVSLGCAIYTTKKRGQTWEEPELVVLTEDSTRSVGHPSLSADDKILYFAGNLEGAVEGSKDLWMTTFDRRAKKWKPATNLGKIVNTAGDELFPFIHDDGYLYFASNGLPGMGGLDIFRVKVREDGMPEGEVENMKYPINTEFEDFGIILEGGSAQKGFITSNRNAKSGDDIYSIFEVPLNFQLEGVISSTKDGKPIPQVTVRLDGSDGTSIVANTDGNGRYVFERDKLNGNTNYRISFEKKKFLNGFSDATTVGVPFDAFEYNSTDRFFLNTLKVNKGLEPIEIPIVLPNVLFDLAKWDLRTEAMVSLDSVVAILNNNPNVVIELRSHTDYSDTDERNKVLSQNRADTCVKYIISKGIASDRLVAVGKGEDEPFAISEGYKGFGAEEFSAGIVLTESYIRKLSGAKQTTANQINRRTDFKVLRDDYIPNKPTVTVIDGKVVEENEEAARPKGEFYVLASARESFGVVARKTGISVRDLKLLNGGLRGVRTFEGLELKITPNGDYDEYDDTHYRVLKEKSFKEIAKKLDLDKGDLEDLNPDLKSKSLVPGRTILIK